MAHRNSQATMHLESPGQQGPGVQSHTPVLELCAVGDFPQPTIALGWSSALDRVLPSKPSRPPQPAPR